MGPGPVCDRSGSRCSRVSFSSPFYRWRLLRPCRNISDKVALVNDSPHPLLVREPYIRLDVVIQRHNRRGATLVFWLSSRKPAFCKLAKLANVKLAALGMLRLTHDRSKQRVSYPQIVTLRRTLSVFCTATLLYKLLTTFKNLRNRIVNLSPLWA